MRNRGLVTAAAVLLGGGALVAPAGVSAQEPTAAATVAVTEHLATIFPGTCRRPGDDPAFVLGVIGPQRGDDVAVADADADNFRGQLVAPPLLTGGGTVEIALDELLDGGQPYAVHVHENTDEESAPVACGEIGGVVANGQLVLALRPVGGSDFAGVAVLSAAEAGGTAGTVLLITDVDAYAMGGRTQGDAGGERVRQGGRQSGGGRAGGQTGGGEAGGVATDGVVTGGVATDDTDSGDRTPRARRTRVPNEPASTAVPTTDDEAPGTTAGEPIGTVTATVEATVADPIATVPVDDGVAATATVEAAPTATVEAVPTEAVPTDVPATTAPEDGLPITVPEETPVTEDPVTEEPAADEAPSTDAIEEAPTAETEGEAAPPVEGETEPTSEEQPAETPAA